MYYLMRDEKYDILSALEKINNGFEEMATGFGPW